MRELCNVIMQQKRVGLANNAFRKSKNKKKSSSQKKKEK